MLKDLVPLKENAKQKVASEFSAKLTITPSIEEEIKNLFTTLYPSKPSQLVDHSLRVDNTDDTPKAQTSYLPIQWFLRISFCEDFILALKEYSIFVEKMKDSFSDDDMKELPKIDWETTLPSPLMARVKDYIEATFDNDEDKSSFSSFLDGRSWLETKNGSKGLTGRSLNRRPDEYIGSAIAGVVRFINENSGSLPLFINLYLESDALRAELSKLDISTTSTRGNLRSGENKVFYGAPGTGKSYQIDKLCSDSNSIRTVFHPETQNSDFVGCLKPGMRDGNVVYSFRPGPFSLAVTLAHTKPNEHVFLIIEEINRAAAAAVFGELFQLLDRSPDGTSKYSITVSDPDMLEYFQENAGSALEGEKFRIPANLSIYATMNSSDQAVMQMDTAFKRRWKFEYIPIDFKKSNSGPAGNIPIQFSDSKERNVPWRILASSINEILESEDIPEDRFLGPWFISDSEVLDRSAALASLKGKLLLYLWDDVLRHSDRTNIFCSKAKAYSSLIKLLENGSPIFSERLEKLMYKELTIDQEYKDINEVQHDDNDITLSESFSSQEKI